MAVSESFLAFVLEQLEQVDHVTTRRMFGGVGLYAAGTFFALLDDDTLYFKVNDQTRPDYVEAGSGPFRPFADRPDEAMNGYYAVPASVLEDRDELAAWAQEAVGVALTSRKPKPRRGRTRRA